MSSVGIDAGSFVWSAVKLENNLVIDTFRKETNFVKTNAKEFSLFLADFMQESISVIPSAFGSKITRLCDISENELMAILLKNDHSSTVGLYSVLCELKKYTLDAYFIPSVKMLSTVPRYKKVNKIDMGTSDKLCTAIYAMYEQSNRLHIDLHDTSFLLVEIGSCFTSLLFIDAGTIVDGVGGTSGPVGLSAKGAIDGELFSIKEYSKESIYRGGLRDILDESIRNKSFLHSLQFHVAGIISTNKVPKEILVSFSDIDKTLLSNVTSMLSTFSKVTLLERERIASNAAYGAALIANDITKSTRPRYLESMYTPDTDVLDLIY